mgnify:CR=1 FL=1
MYKVPQKLHPLKEKPYKNRYYLKWMHSQGLTRMVCGVPQVECHHIDQGMKGRADNRCVMLCPEHHRGRFSPHGADKKEFEAMYMDEMEDKAAELFELFKEEECV